MSIHTTGPAVKNHISSEMARELMAKNPTMHHLWFLVYQRVLPQPHLHLLLHHLHHRILYLTLTDTPKIQHQKGVEVRTEASGRPAAWIHRNRKQKIKWGTRRSIKRYIAGIAWLATGIPREFGWWKYFNTALGKPRGRKSRHFQFFSWIASGAASKSGTGFGWAQCKNALSEGPKSWHLFEDEINKGFLQKTHWYSCAQSGQFW